LKIDFVHETFDNNEQNAIMYELRLVMKKKPIIAVRLAI
jgi:hypothetical protein